MMRLTRVAKLRTAGCHADDRSWRIRDLGPGLILVIADIKEYGEIRRSQLPKPNGFRVDAKSGGNTATTVRTHAISSLNKAPRGSQRWHQWFASHVS